jgi:hypothetical protein
MYSRSKAAGRFSFVLNPVGIVIGYLLTLLAIVAGLLASPFSSILMGLFSVLVGSFFLVAIAVISMTSLFLTLAFWAAFTRFGRRLLFGEDQRSESQWTSKSSPLQKDVAPQGTNNDLWDLWIDGF